MGKLSPGPWEWWCGFTEPRFHKLRAADNTVALESFDPDALIAVREDDAQLIRRAPEFLAMLRELEWAGNQSVGTCPCCERRSKVGHGPEYDGTPCRLAALLAEFPE